MRAGGSRVAAGAAQVARFIDAIVVYSPNESSFMAFLAAYVAHLGLRRGIGLEGELHGRRFGSVGGGHGAGR